METQGDVRWLNKKQQDAVSSFLDAFSTWDTSADKFLTPRQEARRSGGAHWTASLASTRAPDFDESHWLSTPRRTARTPGWERDASGLSATPGATPWRGFESPLQDPGAYRRPASLPPGSRAPPLPAASAVGLSWKQDWQPGHLGHLGQPSTVAPQLQRPGSGDPFPSEPRSSWQPSSTPRPAATAPPPEAQPTWSAERPLDRPAWSYRPLDQPPFSPERPTWQSWPTQPGDQLFKEALRVVARQAQIDARIEDAKALLPAHFSLEEIFADLDRTHIGQVSSTDARMLAEDFGSSLTFAGFRAMVRELRLRRSMPEFSGAPERLTLRDVGLLIFGVGTKAYQAVRTAESDAEAKTLLYLLKYTEQCPRCGIPVQRSAESAGCPTVTCTICGTSFRCYCVVGASQPEEPAAGRLTTACRYQLHRLIGVAAHAAEELERDRERLSLLLAYQLCGLIDIFRSITGVARSFGLPDLKRVLLHHNLLLSEQELGLLWHRYAPAGEGLVTFPDFRRQLQTFL